MPLRPIKPNEARLVLDLMQKGFKVGDLVTPEKLFPAPFPGSERRRKTLREVAGAYGGYLSWGDRRRTGETMRLNGTMFRMAQEWQAQNGQTAKEGAA